jgi:hypothetical protein
MKVREHIWVADKCLACGAIAWEKLCSLAAAAGKAIPLTDERQCIEREDYVGKLCPEPARRQFALNAFDEIGARMVEIEKERLAAINTPDPD